MARGENKAEFEVVCGPMDGLTFSMNKKEFELGRSAGNDVSLPLDERIKDTSHLSFWRSGKKWYVRNNAGGPAYIDGEKIKGDARLAEDQVITVGRTEILVVDLGQRPAERKQEKRPSVQTREGGKPLICPKCGTENNPSARWCENCGYSPLE